MRSMPLLRALGCAALCLCSAPIFGAEIYFRFTEEMLNETPPGFESVISGEGKPGIWKVIEDEVPSAIPAITANAPIQKKPVLAQLSRDMTADHYPILVYTNEVFGDFTFTTRVKCVGGVMEQMAGVVFRYQDERNHYYLRASAKGNTFRFFKVVDGQRAAPIGPEIEIPAGEWHEISVQCEGTQIKCSLNGKQVIPTMTDTTFSAGRVGFWTMSDSVSHFNEARITYKPREPYIRVLFREVFEKYPRVLAMRVYAKDPKDQTVRVMASTEESEVGQAGGKVENEIFETNLPYAGRIKKGMVVTLPVHDRNGDVIAALRVELKSFFGQTENNALARALPIVQDMERRIVEVSDLF